MREMSGAKDSILMGGVSVFGAGWIWVRGTRGVLYALHRVM
jgi:hypothetical protein